MKYRMLDPITVGHLTVKNRIVMPAMECRMNTPEGSPTQFMLDYYEERASGGVGMITVENTFVDNLESRSSWNSSGLYSDHQISPKAQLAETIKVHDVVAVIQLSHGGRQCNATSTGMQCVAPSPIPCKVTQRMPRELVVEEIVRIEDAFAAAALRAKMAGFDGVEIHGAHGYLISEFLSPYANKRIDEYGGSFENRARMPKNVITKIREKVGSDFIVGFKINIDEFLGEEGLQVRDSCRFIKEVQDNIDYVNCSAGNYETGPYCQIMSQYEPAGKLIPYVAEMKKRVSIPVLVVGALNVDLAEKVLAENTGDMVVFGRQLIADPQLPNKLYQNRPEDIRPCCRADEGCLSGTANGYPIRCELNPAAGREHRYKLYKTASPKRITVVGGGCAGMEAARIANEIGHKVILLEKSEHLGGHLIEASLPPFKNNTKEFLDWQIRQLEKSNVNIEKGVDATPGYIEKTDPDIVVIAVGSKYIYEVFNGSENAMIAKTALENSEVLGHNVVVIGGGLVGVETAITLAEAGDRNVTIIEMLPDIAMKMDSWARVAMLNRLNNNNINILTNHKVSKINNDTVICETHGNSVSVESDDVVIAAGLKSDETERDKFSNSGFMIKAIGDCVYARDIRSCMEEAWRVIFQIEKLASSDV